MTLYSPGASFVVPTVVVAVSLKFAVIVSPESFLAQTETLIAVSAIIARKSGSERRDIMKCSPFWFWNWAAEVYYSKPEEQQVPGPHKSSARTCEFRCKLVEGSYSLLARMKRMCLIDTNTTLETRIGTNSISNSPECAEPLGPAPNDKHCGPRPAELRAGSSVPYREEFSRRGRSCGWPPTFSLSQDLARTI